MFEKPDAVRKEGDIESNNKPAIGDDARWAESIYHDRVAEEGGVIENESKLRFKTQTTFKPPAVENNFGKDD